MSKPLFSDFPKINSKQWKQLIQFDLKGADYNETLIWKTSEGIDVKPFYHADEFKDFPLIPKTKATQWIICQSTFVANVQKSNHIALDALKRGAESIKFILPSKDISIEALLKDIDLDSVTIYFELHFLDSEFVKHISIIPT